MVSVKHKGNFNNTEMFLKNVSKGSNITRILDRYGKEGVAALAAATPVETGLTANSWQYKIEKKNGSYVISFYNTNIQNGVPIAVILQYGHGTRNGGWVQGRDYINPAIQPIFDKIANSAWKEVTKS